MSDTDLGTTNDFDATKARRTANALAEVLRHDAWQNQTTGLGTSRDKATLATYEPEVALDDVTLEAMYHHSDLAARACDAMPDEMLRKPYTVKIESEVGDAADAEGEDAPNPSGNTDVETSTALRMKLDELCADARINEALVWAGVFGGCGIIVGANDGQDPTTPINEKNIASVDFLNVIDRRYLFPVEWFVDPLQKDFGKPSVYEIRPQPIATVGTPMTKFQKIHASRLLLFEGVLTSHQRKIENEGWDFSILQRLAAELQRFDTAWQAIANLLQDSAQGVFKLKGLIAALTSENKDAIVTRLQLLDLSRSIARSVVLDAEGEDFHRDSFTFSGIPDLLDKLMLRVAAAVRMPVMVLFGQSPAGLSATGENDLQWWYERCEAAQRRTLKPQLERLIRFLFLAKNGPTSGVEPEKWSLEFKPLRQMTEKETADIRKVVADTDVALITAGVLHPQEVRASRFRPDGWSSETTIDDKLTDALKGIDTPGADGELDPNDPALPAPGTDPTMPPVPGDPAVPGAPAAPATADVQKTALNGAQLTGLQALLTAAQDGSLPFDTVEATIAASFPTLQADVIAKMIAPIRTAGVKKPDPPPAPIMPGAMPGSPSTAPAKGNEPPAPEKKPIS